MVQVDSIIGKLPVVPVGVELGDTGSIPYGMAASFPGVHGESRPVAGDGCRLWYSMSTHWRLAGPATSDKGCIPARGRLFARMMGRTLFTGIMV